MTVYDFKVSARDGSLVDLADYRGQVLIIVNTASKCGLTPQFDDLERLYQDYKDQGLTILGFPCGQFANQEPGTADEAEEFCRLNYGVTFPIMDKIDVNGSDADPLFVWLTEQAPGFMGSKAIKWNFTKFLIDKTGKVVARFGPSDKPEALRKKIEALL